MSGWDRCIHWRVCSKPCPLNLEDCRYYNDGHIRATWVSSPSGIGYTCSHCNVAQDAKTNYCPNCGAEMGETL